MTEKIYLPLESFDIYDNYYYVDNYTIRAVNDNTCTDFILDNHYYTINKECSSDDFSTFILIDKSLLTNDFLYRYDLSSFFVILFFMFFICVYLPYYVFSSLFRKRRF